MTDPSAEVATLRDLIAHQQAERDALDAELVAMLGRSYVNQNAYPLIARHIGRLMRQEPERQA